jgi:hypothetical protein
MVLCSLLGNYPHVPPRARMTGEARVLLYRLLNVESRDPCSNAWFQSLLHGCPALVVWCVREYLVHALLDDPGMRAQVEDVMNFARFRELVARAMLTARTYIRQNILHAT